MDAGSKVGWTRRSFLAALLAAGAISTRCGGRDPRPSLLVLVSDDQRADTLGCTGNAVAQTPHLDALAAEGVLFENAFVTTSVCPTSRASILTGQTVSGHGVRGFDSPLPVRHLGQSYPVLLGRAGYRTGFVGKWGLGGQLPHTAFDVFEGFAGQGEYYERGASEPRHLTERLTERAVRFLEEQPEDRPFCLSVSYKAPHGPWFLTDPAFSELYRDVRMPLGRTATLEAAGQLAPFLRESMAGERGPEWLSAPERLQGQLRNYYRLIAGIDASLGAMRESLEETGWADRTAIVFTSDNGLMIGEHGLVGKWVMYEESIRVPLIVSAPFLPGGRGRRVDAAALNIDIAPTLLDLAGLPPSPSSRGRSLAPWLRGAAPEWRRDWYYRHDLQPRGAHLPVIEGVRGERWKYVRYADRGMEHEVLFDLERDPDETTDLSARPQHREVLEELRRRWRAHRAAAG